MATKTITRPSELVTKEQCIHYWIIEPPEGPISRGVCKICGEEKEFGNYYTYSPWEGEDSVLSKLGIVIEGEDNYD